MTLEKVALFRIPNLRVGNKIIQKDISIDWEYGQQWCVVGPTGSGKTSLLKAIVGMLSISDSTIKFPQMEKERQNTKGDFLISDKIAFVPQEVKIPSGFLSDLYYQRRYHATEQDDIPTVRDILVKVSMPNGVNIDEIAGLMSLTKLLYQPFVQLSNGQTRRLMIAIALIKDPAVLVMDNPYTGLDKMARQNLNNHIQLLIDNGVNVLIAAHEHEVADMAFVTNKFVLQPTIKIESGHKIPEYYKYSSKVKEEDREDLVISMMDISVKYGDTEVLNLPRWQVGYQQKWLIRGANGSGKSTLLSLIVADHPQVYSNNVCIMGKRRGTGESIWDIKRRMGYFSSELLRYFSLFPLTRQVIASGWNDIIGQVKSTISQEHQDLVEDLAKWLGISSLLDIRFGSLSFGQQKMVLIARAMIRNPEILIFDEPLQGMDVEWREIFKRKIYEFSIGKTILYVTHDNEEVPDGDWDVLNLDL